MTLEPDGPTKNGVNPPSQEDDCLTLSTIHQAKGKEWKSLFVLNVVDGCMPSHEAQSRSDTELERRLPYLSPSLQ